MELTELSSGIGVSSGYLSFLLHHHDKYYKTFYIKKRKGKKQRLIATPNYEIKAIQGWLLRNYLDKIEICDRATGFVKKKGIKENARYHLGQKYIMCLDIKDFFPSIDKSRIYKVLLNRLNDDYLSYFISEISTFKDTLPQGGVTSPVLSNIVFNSQDDEIKKICNETNINYSRYADDLCFSSNYFRNLSDLQPKISKIIQDGGFKLNDDKTRFMSGKHKKMVTGLFLNEDRLTVGRRRKRNVRAALHNFIVKNDTDVNINEVYGMISFISDIDNNYKVNIKQYIQQLYIKHNINHS